MKIVISSGHGAKIAGANAIIKEVPEARRVVDRVAALIGKRADVTVFHENNASSQSANVSAIIAFHNKQTRDRDVSVHFNSTSGGILERAIGTETLFVTQQALATKVSNAIAKAGGFINRGAKKRTDLGFLNKTSKPAILIEVCFVNSKTDVALYQAHFEKICKAIADSII